MRRARSFLLQLGRIVTALAVLGVAPARAAGPRGPHPESTLSVRGAMRSAHGASSGADYRVSLVRREAPADAAIFSDDFESGDLTAWAPPWGMPTGTVVFFDRTSCPAGWTELAAARGRAIAGLPLGGTVAGSQGSPLANLDVRLHLHLFSSSSALTSSGNHAHGWSWSSTAGGLFDWYSYDANGNATFLFEWTNGVGNEGSGIYPFTTDGGRYFGVASNSGHAHIFSLLNMNTTTSSGSSPYLQLLACRKS